MQTQVISFILSILFCLNLSAQIKSPTDFLPTHYGESFTPHHQVINYFRYVAEDNDRMKLIQYGLTNEDRPLYVAIVSSSENIANLEEIRKNNLRQTGLLTDSKTNRKPVSIVWLSHGVHGNEAGATESSLQSLYELMTKPEAAEWLKNTVVIFDPSVNPDGYSRYAHWNRGISNDVPDIQYIAREHNEPWPGGRVNHYYFDLNRDWAWATQVETQQRLTFYHQWMPHIHADLHEQYPDNPYFFAPAARPLHKHITPFQYDFQTEIGKNHASYFDKEGWLYFTREVFDLFYPSYGDTYPTFNGAIGMTYEQAGHGISGRAINLENGDTLRLMDRIMHHKTTALSTIEIASKNSEKLNNEFVNYFKNSKNNPPGEYKSFVISAKNPSSKIKSLTEFLDLHKIKYGTVGSDKSIKAFSYQTGKEVSTSLNSDDIVISAYQPMGLLTQVLFEPETELEDSLTYDITAWALPYARGLEAYAVKTKLEPKGTYSYKKAKSLAEMSKTPYAFFAKWESLNDAKFLAEILKKNINVRYSEKAFTINGMKYDAGTLLILKADNKHSDNYVEQLLATADTHNIDLTTSNTGFSNLGHDLGSDAMKFIKRPKVAILAGEKIDANSFGFAWHFFEQELSYAATIINIEDFSISGLQEFNVLVLPDGQYGFSNEKLEKLSDWVSSGGKVISIGQSNSTFADNANFGLESVKSADTKTEEEKLASYGDRERRSIANYAPGAIYEVKVDASHPLSFGLGSQYFTLKNSSSAYSLLEKGWNVGHLDTTPRSIGFVGHDVKAKMKNTLAFGVEDKGSGTMVYLIDNPLFRGFWEEGKLLMSNAVFMVK